MTQAGDRPSTRLLRLPIYPAAIAITFVLGIGLPFAADAPSVARPALVALVIAAGLTAVAALITRNWDEGGILPMFPGRSRSNPRIF